MKYRQLRWKTAPNGTLSCGPWEVRCTRPKTFLPWSVFHHGVELVMAAGIRGGGNPRVQPRSFKTPKPACRWVERHIREHPILITTTLEWATP